MSWGFESLGRGYERAILGESPCWDPARNELWWVDIVGRRLMRTRVDSGETEAWTTPELVGFVVLTGTNAPAVGMETGIFTFDPHTRAFTRLVRLDAAGCRFNDATVATDGRLWASTMGIGAERGAASIQVVTDGLALETVVSGLAIPNGLAVDQARGRVYYSDSHAEAQDIWTMPLDGGARPFGDPRRFATTKGLRGRPDGAALGIDGSYWIAGVDGGELYVYNPDGTLGAAVPVPFPEPTKLCFLGGDGRTIAVTSKGSTDAGGRLALARVPDDMSAGTIQPYWSPGAT